MQARRRYCGEGRDIVDPRRNGRAERVGHSHARGRDKHIGDTSQLLDIGENWRLNPAVLAAFFAFVDEVSEFNVASRFV